MNFLLNPVTSTSTLHSTSDFNNVDAIRAATASAPNISHRVVPLFDGFGVVSVEEVTRMQRCIPAKQCDLDPILTMLIKSKCDIFSPIIASKAHASFEQGIFPSAHKHVIVRPRIKQPSLDLLDIKLYRHISNLSLISKVVEWLAVNRLSEHISQHRLLPERQSTYRRHHSTETAVTIVHNDIVRATDFGLVSALVLLDLSAAFDIVDHNILINILSKQFGIQRHELDWFQSYHTGRSQTFSTSNDISQAGGSHVQRPTRFGFRPERVCCIHGRHSRNHRQVRR